MNILEKLAASLGHRNEAQNTIVRGQKLSPAVQRAMAMPIKDEFNNQGEPTNLVLGYDNAGGGISLRSRESLQTAIQSHAPHFTAPPGQIDPAAAPTPSAVDISGIQGLYNPGANSLQAGSYANRLNRPVDYNQQQRYRLY